MVKIPDDILLKIAEYICSDTNYPFPYRTGSELSLFFGSVGLRYSHDGSTRKWWTLEVLKQINTITEGGLPSRELTRVIEYLVAPHNSDSQEQQSEQIIQINHLIKQFSLELAYVDLQNNVILFYKNRKTSLTEYYEGSIKVLAENIRWIRKSKKDTKINSEDKDEKVSLLENELKIDSKLSNIEEKLEVISLNTKHKLNAIKGDTEQIIEEVSQLEKIFDGIENLEYFLIENLGSDFKKIKYAINQYKEGKITKKELAKKCIKAFGRQVVKRILKSK